MNLQHMDLSGCKKLKRLPDSLSSKMNLHHMDLSGCEKLEMLPNSFGNLSSLKYLDASCCSNLTISSNTLGNIRTFEQIDLSGCEKIEVWPSQLAHQRFLKILKLTGTNFKELPSAIEVPSDLKVLWIGSPLLDMLHPLLGDLRNVKELRLENSRELRSLPASVTLSSQLTWLEVAGCPVIELPFKTISEQRETVLTLESRLYMFHYMPRLQYLNLQDTEIAMVSFDKGLLSNLEKFILKECINLVCVRTLPDRIRYVELRSCYNLKSTENLSYLPLLRTLHLQACNELQELPNVGKLVSLKALSTIDCVKLKSIRCLAQLTKLRDLCVSGCLELEVLEGVEYCISLLEIYASRCPKLQWGEGVMERLLKNGVRVDLQELN